MEVLECLARAGVPLSLQELSNELGWPKSTLHGLLSALRLNRMVEQNSWNGKYFLGMRLFELGNQVSAGWDILSVARPLMRQLSATLGESVQLALLNRDTAMVLESSDPGGMQLRISVAPGTRLPLSCTALGKVLLAYAGPAVLDHYLHAVPLMQYTPHSITTGDKLRVQLEQIQDRQLAIEDGEYRIGLRGVAAPIFDAEGCRYALGCNGLYRRISGEAFQRSCELIRTGAKQLTQWLKSQ